MNYTKLLCALTLCVLLCLMVGLVVDQAYAQKTAKEGGLKGDKGLADKKGLAVLGSVKRDIPTASTAQKAIGVGSIFVMIAVVKWL